MIYNYFFNLTGSEIASAFICCILPLVYVLTYVLYAVYGERKVSAFMQDRIGPNRCGYRGLLQTVADLLKMLQKEDIVPRNADKPFWVMAPIIVFTGCFTAFACIPFSSAFVGSAFSLGILIVMAASSISAVGLLMAGWSSNNKYSLLGSLRSVAQIVSYEIPTFLVVLVMIIILGTLDLTVISEKQTAYFWNWMILGGPGLSWQKFVYIPFMVSSFIIIYISTLAEVNRTPFDIPEAEAELVAGYHTEYTGMKFGMFFLSEYGNMFAVSAIVSILFFGGYQSP
ncbi:MAG: NADH-quinone oxidoreductase subunit H, partial [Bacteroidota bacterium]|nr:NADH-quinone oxidoreductase subunit H [Bacteroidota bacterium]